MTNPEWKKFTGSDEQIAELKESLNKYGFITGSSGIRWNKQAIPYEVALLKLFELVTHYLVCHPHTLADMICQQAMTGQPVWVKVTENFGRYGYACSYHEPTTSPDWNMPGAEYSFNSFEE